MSTPQETALLAIEHRLGQIRDNLRRCRLQVERAPGKDTGRRYSNYVTEYERLESEALAAVAWVKEQAA